MHILESKCSWEIGKERPQTEPIFIDHRTIVREAFLAGKTCLRLTNRSLSPCLSIKRLSIKFRGESQESHCAHAADANVGIYRWKTRFIMDLQKEWVKAFKQGQEAKALIIVFSKITRVVLLRIFLCLNNKS